MSLFVSESIMTPPSRDTPPHPPALGFAGPSPESLQVRIVQGDLEAAGA